MLKRKWLLGFALLIPALAMPAAHHNYQTGGKGNVSSEWSRLQESMEEMHTEMMSVASSGNSDVDFVRLMLPHHQAAIDMAKAQLLNGTDPQMRRLAQEIITDQQSEIELMRLWLKQHSPTSPKAHQPSNPDVDKER